MTAAASPQPPNREGARALYRRRASRYDLLMARTGRWRAAAVDALELTPGSTVVDVACGTGLNFARVRECIGPEGRLIGVDISGEMLTMAEARTRAGGWGNVELIEADIEDLQLTTPADAALYSFTHDVLQWEGAVAAVVSQLQPAGRIASVGASLAGPWNPINLAVRLAVRPFVTNPQGLKIPWRTLSRFASLRIQSFALGGVYLASGSLRAGAEHLAAQLAGQREGRARC